MIHLLLSHLQDFFALVQHAADQAAFIERIDSIPGVHVQ